MQEKSKVICLITCLLYIVALFTMPYVSVYITYFAIPIIVLFGIIGFATFDSSLNNKAQWVFWGTLGLWIITLLTVSYVGVYLIWVVAPILFISGSVWFFTRTRKEI